MGTIIRPGKGDRRQFNADGKRFDVSRCAPLVTLDNVRAIVPDDFVFQYPVWNMIPEYKTGAKVRHNGKVWIARRDNQNVEPVASDFNDDFNNDYGNPDWGEYNYLSDYLERLTRNGIAQMVQTFTQIKGIG